MKEAVTKVTDMLTQGDFHGALQNLLEWYNKCIAARRDYFEVCIINKIVHTKSLEAYLMILVPISSWITATFHRSSHIALV